MIILILSRFLLFVYSGLTFSLAVQARVSIDPRRLIPDKSAVSVNQILRIIQMNSIATNKGSNKSHLLDYRKKIFAYKAPRVFVQAG